MLSTRFLLHESFAQAFAVVREYRLRSTLGALAMAAAVIALAGISTGLEVLESFAARATARSSGSDVFSVSRVGQRARLGRRELAKKIGRGRKPGTKIGDTGIVEPYRV